MSHSIFSWYCQHRFQHLISNLTTRRIVHKTGNCHFFWSCQAAATFYAFFFFPNTKITSWTNAFWLLICTDDWFSEWITYLLIKKKRAFLRATVNSAQPLGFRWWKVKISLPLSFFIIRWHSLKNLLKTALYWLSPPECWQTAAASAE